MVLGEHLVRTWAAEAEPHLVVTTPPAAPVATAALPPVASPAEVGGQVQVLGRARAEEARACAASLSQDALLQLAQQLGWRGSGGGKRGKLVEFCVKHRPER